MHFSYGGNEDKDDDDAKGQPIKTHEITIFTFF